MSERELAKSLIDHIPESRLFYVISYLQGAAVPDETPNAETFLAIQEADVLKKDPGKKVYSSFSEVLEELESDE